MCHDTPKASGAGPCASGDEDANMLLTSLDGDSDDDEDDEDDDDSSDGDA